MASADRRGAGWLNEISVRQVFNLIFVHLLNKTEHSGDCAVVPKVGLVCADDCRTRQFLAWLDEPRNEYEARKDRAKLERKLNERWQSPGAA